MYQVVVLDKYKPAIEFDFIYSLNSDLYALSVTVSDKFHASSDAIC